MAIKRVATWLASQTQSRPSRRAQHFQEVASPVEVRAVAVDGLGNAARPGSLGPSGQLVAPHAITRQLTLRWSDRALGHRASNLSSLESVGHQHRSVRF